MRYQHNQYILFADKKPNLEDCNSYQHNQYILFADKKPNWEDCNSYQVTMYGHNLVVVQ
jgi:hypothetical protein